MSKITKEQVLDNLEEVKKYIQEAENKKEEVVKGLEIKSRWTGEVKFISTKTTYKEACEDNKADLRGADLREANLYGADLENTELMNTKFYGKDGNTKIKKSGLDNFLKALGIIVED